MIISSDLYHTDLFFLSCSLARESRESRYVSAAGILLPATELPAAAGCHVWTAALQLQRWPRWSMQRLLSYGGDPIARRTCWTSYAGPRLVVLAVPIMPAVSHNVRHTDVLRLRVGYEYASRLTRSRGFSFWRSTKPYTYVRCEDGNWFDKYSYYPVALSLVIFKQMQHNECKHKKIVYDIVYLLHMNVHWYWVISKIIYHKLLLIIHFMF